MTRGPTGSAGQARTGNRWLVGSRAKCLGGGGRLKIGWVNQTAAPREQSSFVMGVFLTTA